MEPENLKVEEPITSYGQLDLNRLYNYWDYLKWQFSERVELIRGKIVKMSPAPSNMHQVIARHLYGIFYNHLLNHSCQWFPAPYDIRLPVPSAGKDTTIVQPDLCVICDASKIDEQGCNGAPDLVVEILSPQSFKHDTVTKFQLYEESGVLEYWMVNPMEKSVSIFNLSNGKYVGKPEFRGNMKIESTLIPEINFSAEDVFSD